jgi:hypothetical protein
MLFAVCRLPFAIRWKSAVRHPLEERCFFLSLSLSLSLSSAFPPLIR